MLINFFMYMYLKNKNIYLILILRFCLQIQYLKLWDINVNGNVLKEIFKFKNKYKIKYVDRNVYINYLYFMLWLLRKFGD